MRRCIALLALSLGACAPPGGTRLQGHWRGVRAEGVPDDAAAAANQFARQLEIDISGDTVRVSTMRETRMGHFKVIRDEVRQVVIATDTDGPNDPQSFTFTDERTMVWAALPGRSIALTKQ